MSWLCGDIHDVRVSVQLVGSNFGSVAAAVNVTIDGTPCVIVRKVVDTGVVCRTHVMAGGLVTFEVANQSATGAAVTFDPEKSLPTASVQGVARVPGGTGGSAAATGLPLTGGGLVAVTGKNMIPNAPAEGVIMRTGPAWAGAADCNATLAVLRASGASNFCTAGSVTWTSSSVSCTLPPSRTALVYLSVVTVVSDACKSYTTPWPVFYDPPRVARVAGGGASLLTSGGTRIGLTGQNFPDDTGVFLGGVACAAVEVHNDTTLACTAPAGAGTNVTLSLNSSAYPGVGVLQLPRLAYRAPILAGVAPSSGPAVGGTTLQISGYNFAQGRTSAAVGPYLVVAAGLRVSADGTSLTVVAPAGHGARLNVSFSVGNQSTTLDAAFSYWPPVVSSTLPPVLDGANGGALILNGSNFVPPGVHVSSVHVWVNQNPCVNVVRMSDTTISCAAPPMFVSRAAVVLVDVDGASGRGVTRVACLAGYYGRSDGATCAPCPTGALCPGYDVNPLPLAGYSRVSEALFVPCVPPQSCVGLENATVVGRLAGGASASDAYANCAMGYCDSAGGYGGCARARVGGEICPATTILSPALCNVFVMLLFAEHSSCAAGNICLVVCSFCTTSPFGRITHLSTPQRVPSVHAGILQKPARLHRLPRDGGLLPAHFRGRAARRSSRRGCSAVA